MAIKKRNKISAQFNMSSLTDIIFLLLIFFMLTSSLIVPNALNLKLPGQGPTTTVSKRPDEVRISSSGKYYFNGKQMSASSLSSALRGVRSSKGAKASVIITPDGRAGNQYVVTVLDLVRKARLTAVLNEAAG